MIEQELSRWLMDEPHQEDDGTSFMRTVSARLVAAGVPVWRISCALMTKQAPSWRGSVHALLCLSVRSSSSRHPCDR